MNRRAFARLATVPIAVRAARAREMASGLPETSTRPGSIKLGNQHWSDDASLRVLAALGVNHICSALPSAKLDENWSVEGLVKLRERVESLGIPMVKYNLTILGVVRSEPTPGRGGAKYSSFRFASAKQDPPLTEAGPVSADEMWERITYLLERIVPVAEEVKVRLACHPNDPGMPEREGFRGVHCVLGSVAGLKRFIDIHASPYHGINFCQGTVCEMLSDPNREIHEVIRYFGSRKKIFNVHFRNIRGGFLDFQETFPDAGDVDMPAALRTYKEIGYDGMLMPDHVPAIEGDTGGRQAFAFAFGYIRGLLDAVPA
jgi:mannonate dehydratase